MITRSHIRSRPRALMSISGMTLIELLIGGLILGAVTLGAMTFYMSQHSQYLQQSDVSDMQQNLRVVMIGFATHIRQAGYEARNVVPAQVMGSNNDMLLLRYHDGDSVRSQVYFLITDSLGVSNLMTQLNGETPQMMAEGIVSLIFDIGGAGGDVDWISVGLVARSKSEGFRTIAYRSDDTHLYRRLNSVVKLRNG